jgi:hypothetical protein
MINTFAIRVNNLTYLYVTMLHCCCILRIEYVSYLCVCDTEEKV